MKIIVGLGNPGPQFERTRHNVGYMVVDELSRRWTVKVNKENFFANIGTTRSGDETVMLLKPLTFMNESGRAVQAAMAFHKLSAQDLLVVADDMALPLGRIRLRRSGSSGGHKGLADVAQRLANEDYPRLRVGIDQPGTMTSTQYVLSAFSPEQLESVNDAIARAADAVQTWLERGIDAAMNECNSPAS